MSSPPRQVIPTNNTAPNFDDWQIGDRYHIQKQLGKGSYGKVVEAVDRMSGMKVAIKQMKKIFREPTDAKRAYREIHILRQLKHPNIVALLDVISTAFPRSPSSDRSTIDQTFVGSTGGNMNMNNNSALFNRNSPRDVRDLGDLYLVFEYMDTDLAKIMKSDQFLSLEHIQYILYQILVGIKFIHSARVIHRDIKPANILIRCDDCLTKIADFGLSRVVDESQVVTRRSGASMGSESGSQARDSMITTQPTLKRGLTCHVVTRWYRAPEIILSQPYTSAVDMWSVGCILGELFGMQSENISDRHNRRPMFPGQSCGELSQGSDEDSNDMLGNEAGQLMIIFKTMGTPSPEDLDYLDDYTAKQIGYFKQTPAKDLKTIFPGTSADGIDLLRRMLHFNPRKRISVEEALAHPFVSSKRVPTSEVVVKKPMSAAIETVGESSDHLYENVVNELMYYR